MNEPDLDRWLANPDIRSRHRATARADPETLWHAAEGVLLRDTGTLGRVVRWRIPGTPPDAAFRDLFREHPFTVLDEGHGWTLSGLAGRIWTLDRDYPRLEGPEEFRTWDEPGTVRVLFGHWVEPAAEGSAIVSEARVAATSGSAGVRLRALWAVIGHLERLIGGEALALAVRRADQPGSP